MPLDYGGPDLGGIGSVARASKQDSGGAQELTSFSVKKGDNGGVLVCETYTKKAPAGRRSGAAFPGGGDYKENPFSPDDGAAASSHIRGLLSQMGVTALAPAPAPAPTPPRGPTVAAARGPNLGVARVGPPPGPPDTGY